MKKPNKKDYGFIENDGFDSEPSGWTIEEGEDYYLEAIDKYNKHIKDAIKAEIDRLNNK